MPATRHAVLAKAASQIGYAESPAGSNKTKYGKWYGMDGSPWCAMFVSWVAAQCNSLSIVPKHAYTPTGASWFKKKGRWHHGTAGIRSGDIVYFDWPGDGVNRISHVGFVEKVRGDGALITIEGNTSDTDNRNGGMVMRRVRARSHVVGYGRPAYKPVAARRYPGKIVRRGQSGGNVRWIQKRLLHHGYKLPEFGADGKFGDETEHAVRRFQRSLGWAAGGGKVGPKTWAKLAEK